uniref:Uncharacterized protein n=1 Tax=Rhizophora mucronata TaxID=61149 RepID=A0A2P2PM21_RHIMU
MLTIGRYARIRSNKSSGKITSTEIALGSSLPSLLSSENESKSPMSLAISSKQPLIQDVSPAMMNI